MEQYEHESILCGGVDMPKIMKKWQVYKRASSGDWVDIGIEELPEGQDPKESIFISLPAGESHSSLEVRFEEVIPIDKSQ